MYAFGAMRISVVVNMLLSMLFIVYVDDIVIVVCVHVCAEEIYICYSSGNDE